MKLQALIDRTKTASQKPTAEITSKTAETGVEAAIKIATQAIPQLTKEASADNPVKDLSKLAQEVAQNLRDSEEQHFRKLGGLLHEGFMQSMAAHELAAQQLVNEKVASEQVTADELQMVRLLRQDPSILYTKLAEEKKLADFSKQAQEYTRNIHQTGMAHYLEGYRAIKEALANAG